MQIQINTGRHIDGNDGQTAEISAVIESSLKRFADQITRVEVHLSDENAAKGGEKDKRCLMEARLSGLAPVAVAHQAGTLRTAVDGAVEKLRRAIESAVGRLRDH